MSRESAKTPELSAESWAKRVVGFMGLLNVFGYVGGTASYFHAGATHSPRGARFVGGCEAVRLYVPKFVHQLNLQGGLFAAINCSMAYVRQKEQPWDPLISAAATSGLLTMRQGLRASAVAALYSGAAVVLLEGGTALAEKYAKGTGYGEKKEAGFARVN